MKSKEIKDLFVQFESVSAEVEGVEFWSARELHSLLGYTQWRNFLPAIEKAKNACQNAGEAILCHFADVRKMVSVGSGAEREIDDILLTRYACYQDKPKYILDLLLSVIAVSIKTVDIVKGLPKVAFDVSNDK